MITSAFPETLFSLTLQTTMLLLLTRWLLARGSAGSSVGSAGADQVWGLSHCCILFLAFSSVILPHVRLIQSDAVMAVVNRVTSNAVFDEVVFCVFLIWISGVVFLGLSTLHSLIRTSLQVRRSAPLPLSFLRDSDSESVRETASNLELMRVRVYQSAETAMPFCWQLHFPVIVLPETLTSFPPEELDAVIRHELAHLRSQHPLLLFLQRLVEILYWFNPLVWSTSREASLFRELAADRAANSSGSQAAVFLKGMVRLSDDRMLRSGKLIAGLAFGGRGSSMIEQRVRHLLAVDWSQAERSMLRPLAIRVLLPGTLLASVLWVPVNSEATGRTILSPWPKPGASVLHEMGLSVRDYEIDSHRLHGHRLHGEGRHHD